MWDMSPFALFMRAIQDRRRLKPSELAEQLGYERSYVSSIVSGARGLPRRPFIVRLIDRLKLTPDEIEELNRVVEKSDRRIVLPANAPVAEYELWHQLREQSGHLTPGSIRVIMTILEEAAACACSAAARASSGQERRRAM